MIDRLFLAHPRSVEEGYFQHMGFALGMAARLAAAAAAAVVHAFIPALCARTASRAVARMHARMAGRGSAQRGLGRRAQAQQPFLGEGGGHEHDPA